MKSHCLKHLKITKQLRLKSNSPHANDSMNFAFLRGYVIIVGTSPENSLPLRIMRCWALPTGLAYNNIGMSYTKRFGSVLVALLGVVLGSYPLPLQHAHNRGADLFNQTLEQRSKQSAVERVHHIHKLIKHYKLQHSARALRTDHKNEPNIFCSWKFVSGTILVCSKFGNSSWRYFGAFLHGVILNRTFVATQQTHCPGTLTGQDWFMTIEEFSDC